MMEVGTILAGFAYAGFHQPDAFMNDVKLPVGAIFDAVIPVICLIIGLVPSDCSSAWVQLEAAVR